MAGLSEEMAEILADEHTRLTIPGDVATRVDVEVLGSRLDTVKADVEVLDSKLDAVKAEMATRADVEALDSRLDTVKAEMATQEDLRREIAASELRMEQRLQNAILEAKVSLIKWMIATMAVFSGVVIGAVAALQ